MCGDRFRQSRCRRIIQLPYISKRFVYPRCDAESVSSMSADILRGAHPIRSWHDACLQSPVAYIRKSIPLDYLLSVGQPLIDNALPEIVLHIPYFEDEIRLA